MYNNQNGASRSGRFQWGSYGFAAGIFVGIIMGWLFNGFVGAFIRVGLVALVVIPIVLAFLAWRKFVAPLLQPPVEQNGYRDYAGAIETRSVVRGVAHEPRAR